MCSSILSVRDPLFIPLALVASLISQLSEFQSVKDVKLSFQNLIMLLSKITEHLLVCSHTQKR